MTRNLSESIYLSIKSKIVHKKPSYTEKIPAENDLVNLYNVSRITIREAVKKLEAEKIVEIRRGIGTFVLNTSPKDKPSLNLKEIQGLRKSLEISSIYLACQNRTDEDIQGLKNIIENQSFFVDIESNTTFSLDFHLNICLATHNDYLIEIYKQHYPLFRLDIEQVKMQQNVERHIEVIKEHRSILNHIINQDSHAGISEMINHLDTPRH